MTRLIQFANNATSRLAANLSSVGLTASLIPGDGSKFPTLSAGQYFMATLIKADGTKEIVKVTARATDTLTIVRAAEAVAGVQTAYSFNAADKIELRLTAGELASEFDRLDKHALTGVLNKSANYTVVADDVSTLVRVNSTAGATTITLPLISSLTEDFILAVAKVSEDTNSVYIAGSGGNTINGATPYAMVSQWQGAWLVADRSTNTWTAVSSGVGSSFVFVDKFTGTGAQTAFTLTAGVYSSNQVEVTISGVTQNPGIDYTASGTTLTFTTAPPNGLVILARYTQSSPQISTGTCTIEKQTATSGQTGFALANGYIPGSNTMQVFVNGLLLSVGTDYTETGANSVAFTSGLTLGDEVQFVVFGRSVGATSASNVSYTPAGTGVVTTDVQTFLRLNVNVQGYGADPSGTVDSYAAIQLALDTAGASPFGGIVRAPYGVYRCSAPLVIPTLVHFVGDGLDNTAIRYYGTGGSAIKLEGTIGASIVKSSVSSMGIYDYATGDTGINMVYCHYSALKNLRIYGFGVGLAISNCWNDIYNDVLSENNTQDGFNISTTDANALLFTSCQGVLNGRSGVYVNGGRAIDFVGCTFENNTLYGVQAAGGSTYRPLNVTFQGCYIEGNGTYEVYLDSDTAYTPYGVNLRDCYFEFISGKASTAIKAVKGNTLVIDGCTFDNQGGNYSYSLDVASTFTNLVWGTNLDTSTNGIFSATYYRNEPKLETRAWGRFTVAGSSITSVNSFGISNVTWVAAGVYEVTMQYVASGTNYCVTASAENGASYVSMLCSPGQPISSTVFRINTGTDASTLADARTVSFSVLA